jgi:hypothetical protein
MWIFYSRVVDKATCRAINYTATLLLLGLFFKLFRIDAEEIELENLADMQQDSRVDGHFVVDFIDIRAMAT